MGTSATLLAEDWRLDVKEALVDLDLDLLVVVVVLLDPALDLLVPALDLLDLEAEALAPALAPLALALAPLALALEAPAPALALLALAPALPAQSRAPTAANAPAVKPVAPTPLADTRVVHTLALFAAVTTNIAAPEVTLAK